MKFIKRIETTLLNTKRSVRRFPITVGISTFLAILLIYFNENSSDMTNIVMDNFIRLNMVVGLGIIISLCIGLFNERFFSKNKFNEVISYFIGLIFLVLYYYFLLKEFEMVPMVRYFATVIFFILVFFYIYRISKEDGYENYVIGLFSSAALTAIYSGVLYFGLSAILFTIDRLFDINIDSKYYLYMFFIVSFIFAVSLFLSKIPNDKDGLITHSYARSLEILLLYIVIPLLTVYNIILYAYFVKILVTWEWPKGLVSHLVLWSSALSVGVIFLITPVLETSKIAKQFKIWFPKAVLPILVMMFMSIWIRVDQYGVTERRYFVILLGLWITGIMLYYSFKKPLRNIIIPISLSIVVLISVYGPLSSFSVSIRSQNNRLNNILLTNDLLIDNKLVSNSNTSIDAVHEVSNIISYYKENHNLSDIKVLPKDFKTEDMQELFGFAYNPQNQYGGEPGYFYYGRDYNKGYIEISGYDYLLYLSGWNNETTTIADLSIKHDPNKNILTVKRDNVTIFEQDLLVFVEEAYNTNKNIESKESLTIDQLTFYSENENLQLKFVFNSISGRYDSNTQKISIDGLDYNLLVGIK